MQVLLSGVAQMFILGPILFDIFLSDLVKVLKNSDIYNFADDNIISIALKNGGTFLKALQNESESVTNWFRNNNMIVNPGKFQLMLLQKIYEKSKAKKNSKSVAMKLNLRIL